ncbi:hypothetical protein X753_21170 [Mesorhizobium sp. LNJC399B00]|uniref:hypothetical protein n=1 Tax=unclassified Mesorhizobium TaxID=325217 RepID=UPI0003CE9DDF|nr:MULTISPECIES: hypothetical protein [unclassified Mesorhizobium]ESY03875.1 hypothetical protein X753_21170 [Mesorhizobium sp. LNJC399B00]WJI68844.1 hypothetical protein NLY36_29405 [Mesorhizobium sp. C399B]
MIPVTLEWQHPLRDVTVPEGEIDWDALADDERRFTPLTDEIRPRSFTLINLENPISVAMANCRTFQDFRAFINNYGFPWEKDQAEVWQLISHSKDMNRYLAACSDPPAAKLEAALLIRDRFTIESDIHFSPTTGNPELAVKVATPFEFMCLEVLYAFEVGASFQRCEWCSNGFLTGTATGRRNTSRFCRESCRQTALRHRNKAQGDKTNVRK